MLKCLICNTNLSVQEHHLIPQAAGGITGPVVPLCANHHQAIHHVALSVISKNSKQTDKIFTDEQMIRAKPLINFIVIFMQRARDDPNMDQLMTLTLKPQRRLLTVLHMLKADAGFTNLADFCLSILTRYASSKI
jgi:hypothetical protein